MLNLYFLRHGQTEFSRANAFCGSGLDPELTPDGQAMARAVADSLRQMKWEAIYTSTLKRAISTAGPLCEAVGLEAQTRDDLKEIGYGTWEGRSIDEVSRDYHDDYLRWTADPAWNAPTGGEPAVAIAQRGMRVVEEIRETHTDGNVLLVSHKATIRIILCGLLGIDVGRFRFRLDCPVGSLSHVEFRSQGPMLHTLANRAHLPQALRELPGT
jgi:probable phosphoglycerate mutase